MVWSGSALFAFSLHCLDTSAGSKIRAYNVLSIAKVANTEGLNHWKVLLIFLCCIKKFSLLICYALEFIFLQIHLSTYTNYQQCKYTLPFRIAIGTDINKVKWCRCTWNDYYNSVKLHSLPQPQEVFLLIVQDGCSAADLLCLTVCGFICSVCFVLIYS